MIVANNFPEIEKFKITTVNDYTRYTTDTKLRVNVQQ